ncbi:MAG: hypothetical protein K8R92_00725 [Planctomycetes bacterium]|nr:hypothetical protein [Planctomycetota bacterium]
MPRTEAFTAESVDRFPDIKPGVLYVYKNKLVLECPCGCGDNILLNTNPAVRPCWSVSLSGDAKNIPTLTPSVWITKTCLAHFKITDGKVVWA